MAVEIDLSWLLIFGLLSVTLAQFTFPEIYEDWDTWQYWVTGIVAALLLFVAVLVHEFAHTIVAIRRGIDVPRIALFFFGGVSYLSESPRSAKGEFYIAVVGPITSLIIGALCAGLWWLTSGIEQVSAVFGYLAVINVMLAVFNLLPGFPMDGGRVLRAIIWGRVDSFRKATRIAASVGQVFGFLLSGLGIFILLSGVLTGLWFIFIGFYLSSAARSEAAAVELEQILGGLRARDIMRTEFETVEPTLPLQRIIDEHLLGKGIRAVIVERQGGVEGLLSITDLRKVPRQEWAIVPARRVMVPREKVVTVTSEMPAVEVLEVLANHNIHQVPVLEDGRMIGLIDRGALLERIEVGRVVGQAEVDDSEAAIERHLPH